MTNNDILRCIRYAFDFGDAKVVALFGLADHLVTREQVSAWLKKETDPEQQPCTDVELAIFLNGLINDRRGKKDGPQAEPEQRLNNNIIFRKLRIALNLKDDDILEILALAGQQLSKPELSAFFRKPDHKHYRACKDQVLRYFLNGMQLKFRAATTNDTPVKPAFNWESL
ncbi:MAG: DUF1456 domain-containing protein [Zetaproteobacteria bacterium CG12_big_fil_rev_8_21_14_0_65_55_1124]|nr:MAG: hypothetical protein AUJ58_09630 [Zetaproteobacteria bacterium CG1_02_55_237]PIS19356.1 MAG: DUF1456 domain-containing protein [Zetaproteobacteria bacterium CG08_land_8_20_14_0_20_55_17]PIW43402.1 MAG: DUF1456 domain-containing protein [Zetaproteobacteria bacterium CG12_big_fil_rev_8_21_14_0_65_55_1124]PIY53597.1 MAG: DUF1456 domain-containing protein [Zetaproteobacteria bacterium CG_4_10_14_0_8_um_filter_55_43]PIZ37256.1 MAG: DUF1456 domain-containing protein [Zetaproteobacteria bacter